MGIIKELSLELERNLAIILYNLKYIEKQQGKYTFKLTPKGKKFITSLIPTNQTADTWIDEFLNIFPLGVKSGGKMIRSDRKICLTKMNTFLKTYKYPKELILNATTEYIEEREAANFEYTTLASNFISHRDKGSELAARCANYTEKPKTVKYEVKDEWI